MTRASVIALSHGGGPMPAMGDPSHKDIVKSLKRRLPEILKLNTPERPQAIILITAHWSERNPTVSNGEKPKLFYDYYGFPPEAYKLQYDAPGSPAIAKEVVDALKSAGLKPQTDSQRGWDHGVFIPMLLIHPAADIPIIQLSVLSSESPTTHYEMGKALRPLRDRNVAIIGSGFASFHNLRLMFSGALNDPTFRARHTDWNKAVTEGVSEPDAKLRQKKLEDWRSWPMANECHPPSAGEHFMPLLVCAGAGGDGAAGSYVDEFMGLDIHSYYWT
ncbi:Extradiol aromatic ring-opening dioxygenase [Trichodelitschia bisporula]|uniref:Extradiol aromatic ring-opening dioxygenase n=1 Tax=Trichodelitschia bisporula TaxID=703511 RepID=A0A6G1HL27_9PEZI|nr:Extradiol aromatic ring-opening dioxygenase [Trichodelitschia bisporula]